MSLLDKHHHSSTENSNANTDQHNQTVTVWDLPVRLFHWSLVILFITAYVTNLLGTNYFTYHLWSGYAMIVLVSFRLLWGLVGTFHAQFIHFVRNPFATFRYLKRVVTKTDPHYLGHNPLGAWMVVFLLISIFIQAATGLFSNDEIFNTGPLYGYITNELSLSLTSIHRQLFYWIAGAILFHIVAVYLHVVFKKDNIIKSMITGRKINHNDDSTPSIKSSRLWLALIIIIALALLLAWLVNSAPQVSSEF